MNKDEQRDRLAAILADAIVYEGNDGGWNPQKTADALLAAGVRVEDESLIEWTANGKPETAAEWAYELAGIIAKARFGPGVDMGGKHHPSLSEQRSAREFVDAIMGVRVEDEGLREAVRDFLQRWDNPERYHRLPAVEDLRAAVEHG